MPALDIIHVDTCLPGFFSGTPKPVLNVPVDGSTTRREVLEELQSEFRASTDERLWVVGTDFFVAQSNTLFEQAFGSALDEPFDSRIGARSNSEDYGDEVYAYFVVDVGDEDE